MSFITDFLFGSPSMPDIPPPPAIPSVSDEPAKQAKALARKRAGGRQGVEDTMLSGSLGITPMLPGIKTTLG